MPHDTHGIGSLGAFRVPIGGVFAGDDACTVIDVAEVFGKAVVQMPPACGFGFGERVPVAVNMASIAGERRGSGNKLPYGGVGLAQEFAVPVNVVGIGGVACSDEAQGVGAGAVFNAVGGVIGVVSVGCPVIAEIAESGGVGFGNGAQGGFVFGVNVVFVAPEVGGNVFKAGAVDVF